MKNKIYLTILILSNLLIACNTQSSNQISLKESLVNKLINTSNDSKFSKTNEKIIILKTKFCKDFDCENYFQDYKEQIHLYTREDAFMRGISDYVEIEKIDEENGQIILTKRAKDKYEKIEIN